MFSLPEMPISPAKIKVVGVGGCGCNISNYLFNAGIEGVEIFAVNTDVQSLSRIDVPNKIKIGEKITYGLGAGGEPEIGKKSAEETIDRIKEVVRDSNLVFVIAGMGGGTGTGAAPVIASAAKELGALTIAVVTKPFDHERKMDKAMKGILELEGVVDSLLIIPNQKLLSMKNANLFELLEAKTSDIPAKAVQGITEIIVGTGFINRDFEDLKKVMKKRGKALIGIGEGSGQNRGVEAVQNALNSPLLEEADISKAKNILINITASDNYTVQEYEETINTLMKEINENIEVLWGIVKDQNMKDTVRITIIATGIESPDQHPDLITEFHVRKIDSRPKFETKKEGFSFDEILETPTYLRRTID